MALALRASRLIRQSRSLLSSAATISRRGIANQAEEEDIVKATFINQQRRFRALLEEAGKVKFPLDPTDDKAVKDYAASMKAIRQKIGIPSFTEKITNWLDEVEQETPDVRSFMEEARKIREKLGLEDPQGMETSLMGALDKVEKKLGKPLTKDNLKGLEDLRVEFETINTQLGLDSSAIEEVDEEAELALAKAEVEFLRKEALEKIESAKRDGLEDVDIDLKSVDPRPYF
eukprot:TRINITY_DN6892_c0_g1_i1.p1 TRINITY_DN6892_c0_g1~~TRINITY_DN6892_c0_g1_i1.p1  ORF type:complete len:231 (+),score=65.50 TRINITY_DN6892_c0_g1_i1:153-845(+)